MKQKEKNNMAMDLITKQDGTTLHYSTMGQGYPVVLVHTAFDNYAVFNDLAKVLAKSFQVVLIDLRGHGYSDKPRNIEFYDFADDIKFLLDAIYRSGLSLSSSSSNSINLFL